MENKYCEKLVELFEGFDDSELIELHNEYCDNVNDYDNRFISMWDFDEEMRYNSPSDIAQMICYGEFNPNDDYFKFDGYGNLKSFDSWNVSDYIELDEIARYCINDDEDFNMDEIRTILNEYVAEVEQAELDEAIEARYKAECEFDKKFDAFQWGGVVC